MGGGSDADLGEDLKLSGGLDLVAQGGREVGVIVAVQHLDQAAHPRVGYGAHGHGKPALVVVGFGEVRDQARPVRLESDLAVQQLAQLADVGLDGAIWLVPEVAERDLNLERAVM